MDEQAVLTAYIESKLTRRLNKRKRFNIAYCSADLNQRNIIVVFACFHTFFYFIGYMWNYLNRSAVIFTISLFTENRVVYTS